MRDASGSKVFEDLEDVADQLGDLGIGIDRGEPAKEGYKIG